MRRRLVLILALLALAVIAPGAGAAPSSPSSTSVASQRATSLEAALVQQVNDVRASFGLPALSRSRALGRAADAHTAAMIRAGRFAHDFPGWLTFSQRFQRWYAAGHRSWSGAENIAYFGGSAPTARQVVDAWLNSPPHRANLLAPSFRDLGISARFDASASGDFGSGPIWLVTLDLGRRS